MKNMEHEKLKLKIGKMENETGRLTYKRKFILKCAQK
jgi:hypothetical protein